jgi:hypothetical protein
VFHKNLVLCGHGSMMYGVTQLNKFYFISFIVELRNSPPPMESEGSLPANKNSPMAFYREPHDCSSSTPSHPIPLR